MGALLHAALAYAASGRHVFPCLPDAKRPATKHGCKAATTDPDTIAAWWRAHPTMNVAVATGPSRLLVVDLDTKHGVNGFTNWCALLTEVAPDDRTDMETFSTVTPSGGLHFWFSLEPGWEIGNSAGKLAEGIDVRCDGGYVLAPPSTVDGTAYEVDQARDVQPAPDWLIGLLIPPALPSMASTCDSNASAYSRTALDAEAGRVALAPTGQRNHQLNESAFKLGTLVGAGKLDAHTVTTALLTAAMRAGLSEREAATTIASGLTAGARHPRTAA